MYLSSTCVSVVKLKVPVFWTKILKVKAEFSSERKLNMEPVNETFVGLIFIAAKSQRKGEEMERKEKIELKDGTEIEIENGAVENCVQVVLQNLDGFKELHGKFTESNLECYKILNANGLTCATLENKYLKSAVVERVKDGYLISFHLADVNMIQKQLDALKADVEGVKEGQELQDGAIYDLGETVSGIVEGSENS